MRRVFASGLASLLFAGLLTACPDDEETPADAGNAADAGARVDGGGPGADAATPDAAPPDASELDATAPDAEPMTRTVTASAAINWVSERSDGTIAVTAQPQALPASALFLWTQDAQGAFIEHTGVEVGDRVEFREVPVGRYYLAYRPGTGQLVVTSTADAIDFSTFQVGRNDQTVGGPETELIVSGTGLTPFEKGDELSFYSLNSGLDYGLAPIVGPLSTVLEPQSLDFESLGLIDASQGDRAYLNQLRSRTMSDLEVLSLESAAPLFDVVMTAGQTTTASATFSNTNRDQALLHCDVASFDALLPSIHPEARTMIGGDALVGALPRASTLGHYGYPASLVVAKAYGCPEDQLVEFADPYSNWDHFARFDFTYRHILAAAGADPATFYTRVSSVKSFASNDSVHLGAPPLGAVKNVKINGVDAWFVQTNVGVNPRITFDPPDLGTPSSYEVIIYAVRVADRATYFEERGRLQTSTTEITLPPGLLLTGNELLLTIAARVGAVPERPRQQTQPYYSVEMVTGKQRS